MTSLLDGRILFSALVGGRNLVTLALDWAIFEFRSGRLAFPPALAPVLSDRKSKFDNRKIAS
jgi:hypothetical protein